MNFLNFSPGLVGGHCISVDPYYMKYKAEKIGLKTKSFLPEEKLMKKWQVIFSTGL